MLHPNKEVKLSINTSLDILHFLKVSLYRVKRTLGLNQSLEETRHFVISYFCFSTDTPTANGVADEQGSL